MQRLVGRLRMLEEDHHPDGWPAVQMKDISALCDFIEGKERALLDFQGACEDRVEALARRVGRLEGMIAALTGIKPWKDE